MVVVASVFDVQAEIGTEKYKVRAHVELFETKSIYIANMAQNNPVSTVTLTFW
jgi:hypothetical protein